MKGLFASAILVASLAMPAFAGTKAQTVIFSDAVTLGATKLPAGEYKVTWTGTGSDVQVTLQQKTSDNPATATAPAKLTDQKSDRVQFITSHQGNAQTLQTLQLRNVTIEFTSTPASGQ